LKYRLKREGIAWYPLAILALALIVVIRDGLDLSVLLAVPATAAILGIIYELLWRIASYVAFHDSHLQVSRYKWGMKGIHAPPDATVPYVAVVAASVTSPGEVELTVNAIEPPMSSSSRPDALLSLPHSRIRSWRS
jgi:hypothetical protein